MNCKHLTKRDKDLLNNPQLPQCEFSGLVQYSCLFGGSEDLCPKNEESQINEIMDRINLLLGLKNKEAKKEK